MSSQKSSGRI